MTHDDKELLLQDISARLPYGVIIHVNGHDERVDEINPFEGIITCGFQSFSIDECKPYLRPMSSMTEEEWTDYQKIRMIDWVNGDINGTFINAGLIVDWLNAHHFDYRGLIEKELAIAVTEENNPYEN